MDEKAPFSATLRGRPVAHVFRAHRLPDGGEMLESVCKLAHCHRDHLSPRLAKRQCQHCHWIYYYSVAGQIGADIRAWLP
jgi:hypothetical protein